MLELLLNALLRVGNESWIRIVLATAFAVSERGHENRLAEQLAKLVIDLDFWLADALIHDVLRLRRCRDGHKRHEVAHELLDLADRDQLDAVSFAFEPQGEDFALEADPFPTRVRDFWELESVPISLLRFFIQACVAWTLSQGMPRRLSRDT